MANNQGTTSAMIETLSRLDLRLLRLLAAATGEMGGVSVLPLAVGMAAVRDFLGTALVKRFNLLRLGSPRWLPYSGFVYLRVPASRRRVIETS